MGDMSRAKREAYDILHRLEAMEVTAKRVLDDIHNLVVRVEEWEHAVPWDEEEDVTHEHS